MKRASIGVSAHMGWAATATVAVTRDGIRVLRTDRIETAPGDDREAQEPYHVAGGFHGLARVPVPGDPQVIVRRGLGKQRRATARALRALARALEGEGYALRRGGLLVGRGRPAPDVARAVASHPQIHVEEGLAVRASIAAALEGLGARVRELDAKDLLETASRELRRPRAEIEESLAAARPEGDFAWRKEQRLAALAAWLA